ncbi:MAG: FadR/GntR family transcriptional regulator [Thermodesulfobacteriota bacterium]
MAFPILQRRRLYEEVVNALKKTIFSGDYQIGDKLPSEMELAKQFQVSRLVIREAIRYLELTGLIDVKQGAAGGPFVSEINTKVIQENMRDLLLFGKISVSQLYEVRALVEPEVARLAALRVTKKELHELEQSVFISETGKPGIDFIKNNVKFHCILGKSSRNLFYSIIMDCIMDFTEKFVLTIKPIKEIVHSRTSHREIYQAIFTRNPDMASKITYSHIQDIAKQLKKMEKVYLNLIRKNKNFAFKSER